MKIKTITRFLLPALGFLSFGGASMATTPGTDNADQPAYSSGWFDATGATGGFSNWALTTSGSTGFAGFFIGDSTTLSSGSTGANINVNGKSFGMYGNSGDKQADATRLFDSGLSIGQTFAIDLAVNFRDGYKGIDVRDASTGATIFNLNIANQGSGDDYTVNAVTSGTGSLGNTYSSNTAFNVALTQTGTSGGTWVVSRTGGVVSSGSGTYTGLVSGFKLYVGTTSPGDENNLYSNSPTIAGANTSNTWTGTGGANWSNDSNWGGAQPTAVGTLTFSGSTQTSNTVDQNYTANKLLWTGTSDWTVNGSGVSSISMVNYNGTQAKIENQSTGSVTVNLPVTFAQPVNNGANFGEINAVNGDLAFVSGTLAVTGSGVNGIKLWGTGRTTTFGGTTSASDKWFATTGGNTTMVVSGSFSSADIYVMNGSTLNLSSSGSITFGNPLTNGVRLGGDFNTTGNQDQSQGATFALTSGTGGQTFSGIINTASGNSSGAVVVASQNSSGTNTLSGPVYLDDDLQIQQSAGGALAVNGSTIDIKSSTLTFDVAGSASVSTGISTSTSGGTLTKIGGGTLTLSGSNNYIGATNVNNGTLNFDVSETLIGGLNVATSGTAVLTAHSGGAANVKVLDITSLTISGTTPFVGDGGKDGVGLDSPAPVPEPGTIGLLAVGSIGGAILLRRSRRNGAE